MKRAKISREQAEHILFELEDAILKVFTVAELVELANGSLGAGISTSAHGYAVDKLCEEISAFKEEYYRLYGKPAEAEETAVEVPAANQV